MNFKGHFDIKRDASNYSKVVIFSKDGEKDFIHKEYTFQNGKVGKIIDYINWIVSKYEYLNENEFIVNFFRFEDNSSDKELDSIKEISIFNGVETHETLYEIRDNEKQKVYSGEKSYNGEDLIKETFKYPDSDYIIEHSWNKQKNIKTTKYPENDGVIQYTFDSNGFLKEFLYFKHEGYCQKIEYQYRDGKLFKMIEFPHLASKKSFFKKEIKITGKPDFIHETTFQFNLDNNLLEKEVKKDILNNETIEITYYKYEK